MPSFSLLVSSGLRLRQDELSQDDKSFGAIMAFCLSDAAWAATTAAANIVGAVQRNARSLQDASDLVSTKPATFTLAFARTDKRSLLHWRTSIWLRSSGNLQLDTATASSHFSKRGGKNACKRGLALKAGGDQSG